MSSLIVSQPYRVALALAQQLKRLGLANLVASFLETGGVFSILGAQILYLSEPLLGSFLPQDKLRALARNLEDPDAMSNFVQLLRKEQG